MGRLWDQGPIRILPFVPNPKEFLDGIYRENKGSKVQTLSPQDQVNMGLNHSGQGVRQTIEIMEIRKVSNLHLLLLQL